MKFILPCLTIILAGLIKKFFRHSLIRSWQGLIKMYQEFLSYQDLGKIIHVLSRLSRSCMSWQGVSSFISMGRCTIFFYFCMLLRKLMQLKQLININILKETKQKCFIIFAVSFDHHPSNSDRETQKTTKLTVY